MQQNTHFLLKSGTEKELCEKKPNLSNRDGTENLALGGSVAICNKTHLTGQKSLGHRDAVISSFYDMQQNSRDWGKRVGPRDDVVSSFYDIQILSSADIL